MATSPVPAFLTELDVLIRARTPLLWLVSWEEERVDGILEELAQKHGRALLSWSATEGLRRAGGSNIAVAFDPIREPGEALRAITRLNGPTLVALKDFHPYLADPMVVRATRELVHKLRDSFHTVVIVSPTVTLPVELEKDITLLDVPLPTARDLFELIRSLKTELDTSRRGTFELTKEDTYQLIKASLGLTLSEAKHAFAKCIAADGKLEASDIARVLDEKRQVVRKNGLLEYYGEEDRTSIGGLDLLKGWLNRRKIAFSDAARRYGLTEPKGLLLLGVQGCGKSLTARAVAAQWKMPLLRLDVGKLYSGLVGSSEENLRRAIRVAEGVAPAVLWIDEIEKALSGMAGSGTHDTGVTARVGATLLTWLQEKTAPLFVIATANRVEGLPPELLRKGRFDEIFFVDLPTAKERGDIFKIHIAKRGRRPAQFDTDALASLSENFSGAEIEQAVVSALYESFNESVDLAQRHIEKALQETFPLAVTMAEEIDRLRLWAKDRTRPASSPAEAR